eukprot:5728856-Pleurochrysis_carterae.AAC.1
MVLGTQGASTTSSNKEVISNAPGMQTSKKQVIEGHDSRKHRSTATMQVGHTSTIGNGSINVSTISPRTTVASSTHSRSAHISRSAHQRL